ncbi:hypothetical protein MCHIJ_12350 [Mycolicibacterium chitae]|uniref:Uncharacterized protein n=1 Tax=Mycolicibacterium chitae TaxID=1792 RepID=A0A3S4RRK2_MYCCI|nr:hypothetical protein [Mycolicibacterium chitae]MCV7106016.1 hypothetical protein [Mycolicibacterium chitae]BBZ01798.1 hypothetical protein MCHIJ_12350 [Mycolicibacterium chitae]VEG50630.1 Uncharacterised protein [Mycolicibacterium chitae]
MPKFDIATAGIVPTVTLSDAADQDHSTRDAQFAGLHNDLMFLWAMADTANGKRYQLVRTLSASAAFDFTLHECPPDLWAYPRTVRVPGEQDLYWGPIVWTKVDGEHTVLSGNVTMAAKHAMTVSLGPSRYVWKEDDVIDVTLTPLPSNVTRISVPGPPDDVGYTSSGCTVTGTIEGSPVVGGYGGLDRMYCLPGLSAHVSKIAQLEHYWFVWGALFDDGHWETGNAMLGAGGYATATYHRQGEPAVIAANEDVDSQVAWQTRDGVSLPHRATLSFGGRTFDFEGTHNAAACAAALGIAWLHGTVQERGGPTPVKTWATMEVIQRSWNRARTEGTRARPRD